MTSTRRRILVFSLSLFVFAYQNSASFARTLLPEHKYNHSDFDEISHRLPTPRSTTSKPFPIWTDKYNFHIDEVKENTRIVRIFWKDLNSYRNIRVRIYEDGELSDQRTVGSYNRHLSHEISLKEHSFLLYDDLVSEDFITVKVPAQDKVLSLPAFTATYSSDGYNYKWKMPYMSDESPTKIAMIWCDTLDYQRRTCVNILDQTTLKPSDTEANLKFDQYRGMALRIDTADSSTGIILPQCESSIENIGMLKNNDVFTNTRESYTSFLWSFKCPEESETHDLTAYKVYYCPAAGEHCDKPEESLTERLFSGELIAIIEDLIPNTRYKISAAALLKDGKESARSGITYYINNSTSIIEQAWQPPEEFKSDLIVSAPESSADSSSEISEEVTQKSVTNEMPNTSDDTSMMEIELTEESIHTQTALDRLNTSVGEIEDTPNESFNMQNDASMKEPESPNESSHTQTALDRLDASVAQIKDTLTEIKEILQKNLNLMESKNADPQASTEVEEIKLTKSNKTIDLIEDVTTELPKLIDSEAQQPTQMPELKNSVEVGIDKEQEEATEEEKEDLTKPKYIDLQSSTEVEEVKLAENNEITELIEDVSTELPKLAGSEGQKQIQPLELKNSIEAGIEREQKEENEKVVLHMDGNAYTPL